MTSSHCRATPQKLYNYLGKDPSRLILHCLFQVCRTNHSRTHVTILSRQKYGKCIFKTNVSTRYIFNYLITIFCGFTDDIIEFFSRVLLHVSLPLTNAEVPLSAKKISNNPLFITKLCALRFRSTLVKSEKNFPSDTETLFKQCFSHLVTFFPVLNGLREKFFWIVLNLRQNCWFNSIFRLDLKRGWSSTLLCMLTFQLKSRSCFLFWKRCISISVQYEKDYMPEIRSFREP